MDLGDCTERAAEDIPAYPDAPPHIKFDMVSKGTRTVQEVLNVMNLI